MESGEQRLHAELHKLERLEFELTEQDTLVLEQVRRSPDSAVPASQRDLLRKLFQEVEDLGLGYSLPTVDSDDPDSLRPEIRSARAKVVWEIKQIKSQLGLNDVSSKDIVPSATGVLTPAAVEAAPQKPTVKRQKESGKMFRTALNDYDRGEILGEGANGTVYKVSDREGHEFALKLLRRELLGGTKQRRFQRELSFCMTASHPHIIRVLDHGLFGNEGIPFFVMPLFETTLRKAMEKGIDPGRILRIVYQLVLAMEFAHQRDIVHRDLKPENILCDADVKNVVVADFGIAHFSSDLLVAAVETSAHERLANFTYSAPEQRARGQVVGPPADIWALGLIVNELFTGQIPLGRDHRLISSIAPEYARLDQIVDQMLQQSAEARPGAAGILRSHLLVELPNNISSDAAPLTPAGIDSGSELHLSSPANLRLNVKQHESIPGLIFTVTNRRTKNIQDCRVRVVEAQSFDAEVSEYREGLALKISKLGLQKEILAGDETGPYWLLAVRNGRLELGNTSGEGGLRWPAADANDTQMWRLVLSVEAQDIEPWAPALTVEWQRATNKLGVREDSGYAPMPPTHGPADAVKATGEKMLAAERLEFWDQRKMLPDTEILKEIRKRPRWVIWIHPIDFKKARFQTVEHCREFMVSSYVRIKGWMPYPWFSVDALQTESEWVAGEIDKSDGRMRRIERWALFRSGQFVHDRAFDEINDLGDRIHVLEIVDTVTGAFELAARLARRGVLSPDAQLKFEVYGVDGRALTWPISRVGTSDALEQDFWSQDEDFTVDRQESAIDLQARGRELALDASIAIFAKFGWSNPPRDQLAEEQRKRFSES